MIWSIVVAHYCPRIRNGKKSALVRRTGLRHFAADSDRPTILSNRNLPVGPILGLNHALGELFPEKNCSIARKESLPALMAYPIPETRIARDVWLWQMHCQSLVMHIEDLVG